VQKRRNFKHIQQATQALRGTSKADLTPRRKDGQEKQKAFKTIDYGSTAKSGQRLAAGFAVLGCLCVFA
jgi:hypothetical protein